MPFPQLLTSLWPSSPGTLAQGLWRYNISSPPTLSYPCFDIFGEQLSFNYEHISTIEMHSRNISSFVFNFSRHTLWLAECCRIADSDWHRSAAISRRQGSSIDSCFSFLERDEWLQIRPQSGIQTLADQRGGGGARDAHRPLGVQILSFSCSFWQKNCKIIAVLRVGAPPRGNPGSPTMAGLEGKLATSKFSSFTLK